MGLCWGLQRFCSRFLMLQTGVFYGLGSTLCRVSDPNVQGLGFQRIGGL